MAARPEGTAARSEVEAVTFTETLLRVAGILDELHRPWALVGAFGVAAWSEARSTVDIDVMVACSGGEDHRAVVAQLRQAGLVWRTDFGLAMTSFEVPNSGARLDVIFGLTGIEDLVLRRRRIVTIVPGFEAPVASLADMIALKAFSGLQPGREHDLRDLRALLAVAAPADLEAAEEAFRLLETRGQVEPGVLAATLRAARTIGSF